MGDGLNACEELKLKGREWHERQGREPRGVEKGEGTLAAATSRDRDLWRKGGGGGQRREGGGGVRAWGGEG